MSTPAMIYLAINILSLGIVLAKHGKPQNGKYSIWTTSVSWSVCLGLLYWGGFFDRVPA